MTILTPDGWSVTLTHLGSIAVTKGASVAEGDGVGTIGPSGEPGVSDPYVHLGIRRTADEHGLRRPGDAAAAPPAGVRRPGRDRGGRRPGGGRRLRRRRQTPPVAPAGPVAAPAPTAPATSSARPAARRRATRRRPARRLRPTRRRRPRARSPRRRVAGRRSRRPPRPARVEPDRATSSRVGAESAAAAPATAVASAPRARPAVEAGASAAAPPGRAAHRPAATAPVRSRRDACDGRDASVAARTRSSRPPRRSSPSCAPSPRRRRAPSVVPRRARAHGAAPRPPAPHVATARRRPIATRPGAAHAGAPATRTERPAAPSHRRPTPPVAARRRYARAGRGRPSRQRGPGASRWIVAALALLGLLAGLGSAGHALVRRASAAAPGTPSYDWRPMASGARKILVAPAWPYAAGHRHLGHVAGFGVPSDVFARYHRLRGNDVLMVSGTDEHGTPVMVAADEEGKPYGEVADYYNQSFREDFRRLGLSYDLFSRTTTLNHERVIQDLFRTLYEHGAIVEREMLVSFSPATGHTLPDRYIEGTCPICGYAEARGDQCDNCGNQLDPTDLIDPRSRIDGSVARVPRDEAPLPRPAAVRRPAARLDRRRTTTGARTSRTSRSACSTSSGRGRSPATSTGASASRSPGYAEDEHKRIYVWFDAVIGYLSASIEWAATTRRPRRLARVVAEPRRRALLLPGQGQHRLPHRDLAGDAARLRQGRRVRRRARARSSSRTTSSRPSS